MIRYAVSLCLGALLLPMSAAPEASTVYAMGSRDLQTNVPLRAVPMFETFLIRSDAPAGEMTEIILRLFAENKTLRKLSCERWKDGTRLDCQRRKGDDLFYVYFQPKDNTIRLSIDPQNYEPGYKPDYKYFYLLREELRQALEAAFGKEQVIQGAELKATATDNESRKYFKEMFKAPERLTPKKESGKTSQQETARFGLPFPLRRDMMESKGGDWHEDSGSGK